MSQTLLTATPPSTHGRLDALSGRFVRAGADTPASLLAAAERIAAADARVLRLVPYGPEDPAV